MLLLLIVFGTPALQTVMDGATSFLAVTLRVTHFGVMVLAKVRPQRTGQDLRARGANRSCSQVAQMFQSVHPYQRFVSMK
jgi:hypothetical protein